MSSFALLAALIVLELLIGTLIDAQQIRALAGAVPERLRPWISEEAAARTRRYHAERFRLVTLNRFVLAPVTLAFAGLGGLAWMASVASAWTESPLAQGLIFFALWGLLRLAVNLPFSAAFVFGLEARFGFNRTTPATFARDLALGVALGAALGGALLAAVLALLGTGSPWAWTWAWAAVTAFQLAVTYAAPAWILPLFNRYEPLQPGPVRERISALASRLGFRLAGTFTMDGSRRSTKANAFFTGFGSTRKLVLLDTLLGRLEEDEVVGVFAHEAGHFRLGHILLGTAISIAGTGAALAIAQALLGLTWLTEGFDLPAGTLHGPLLALSLLSNPLGRWLSLASTALSRTFERQADAYAARATGDPEALARGLLKLNVDHLAHWAPTRLKVLFDYTHPPVLERVEALTRKSASDP